MKKNDVARISCQHIHGVIISYVSSRTYTPLQLRLVQEEVKLSLQIIIFTISLELLDYHY